MRQLVAWLGVIVAAILFGPIVESSQGESATAVTTYTYTGNNFNEFTDTLQVPGQYTSAMSVTGFFTTAVPLAPNLSDVDITSDVLSFSFSDGRQTLTSEQSFSIIDFIKFYTDANGDITNWYVHLLDGPCHPCSSIGTTNYIFSTPSDSGVIAPQAYPNVDRGLVHNQPGSWEKVPELPPNPVPEGIFRVDRSGIVIGYPSIGDFIANQGGSSQGPAIVEYTTARGFFSDAGKFYAVFADGTIVEYSSAQDFANNQNGAVLGTVSEYSTDLGLLGATPIPIIPAPTHNGIASLAVYAALLLGTGLIALKARKRLALG